MATGARGEAFIETAERTYPVLLTNRALAEAEEALGKSVLAIGQAAQRGDIGLRDTAELLRIGLEYGRREAKWGKDVVRSPLAFDILDEVGFQPVAMILLTCLLNVLSYDREKPGKGEDEETPPA
jgi:hypothetical protein